MGGCLGLFLLVYVIRTGEGVQDAGGDRFPHGEVLGLRHHRPGLLRTRRRLGNLHSGEVDGVAETFRLLRVRRSVLLSGLCGLAFPAGRDGLLDFAVEIGKIGRDR